MFNFVGLHGAARPLSEGKKASNSKGRATEPLSEGKKASNSKTEPQSR